MVPWATLVTVEASVGAGASPVVCRPVVSGQTGAAAGVVAGARALGVLQLPARRATDPNQIMGGIQLIGGIDPLTIVDAEESHP